MHMQGCGLRKITRSPKSPNYEILGAQHLSFLKKVSFSSRLWPLEHNPDMATKQGTLHFEGEA